MTCSQILPWPGSGHFVVWQGYLAAVNSGLVNSLVGFGYDGLCGAGGLQATRPLATPSALAAQVRNLICPCGRGAVPCVLT